jgi:hypothetical protein
MTKMQKGQSLLFIIQFFCGVGRRRKQKTCRAVGKAPAGKKWRKKKMRARRQ